jgi:hypothetical protein
LSPKEWREQRTTDCTDDRHGLRKFILSVNRAAGRGEIEGKTARAGGERVGKGASFKSASSVVAKIK